MCSGNIMLKMDTSNLIDNLSKGKYELRLIDFGMMEKIREKCMAKLHLIFGTKR